MSVSCHPALHRRKFGGVAQDMPVQYDSHVTRNSARRPVSGPPAPAKPAFAALPLRPRQPARFAAKERPRNPHKSSPAPFSANRSARHRLSRSRQSVSTLRPCSDPANRSARHDPHPIPPIGPGQDAKPAANRSRIIPAIRSAQHTLTSAGQSRTAKRHSTVATGNRLGSRRAGRPCIATHPSQRIGNAGALAERSRGRVWRRHAGTDRAPVGCQPF